MHSSCWHYFDIIGKELQFCTLEVVRPHHTVNDRRATIAHPSYLSVLAPTRETVIGVVPHLRSVSGTTLNSLNIRRSDSDLISE